MAEELLCCICKGVLDKPYQSTGCGHLYCFSCVTQWLNEKETCPIDIHFSLINNAQNLQPAPRIVQNLVDKLELSCEYAPYGCNKYIRNDMMYKHVKKCDFNHNIQKLCDCGVEFFFSVGATSHNCIKQFKRDINSYQEELKSLRSITHDQGRRIANLRRQLFMVIAFVTFALFILAFSFST